MTRACLVVQLCPTLCDPRDYSPSGSSVHEIFQVRILEWVAISSSRGVVLTQGSNLSLLHLLPWQAISLPLSYLGSPSAAAAAAKSLQSCPTLCDPIDGSPPGSPVPGILQARTLEWVAISFSNAWSEKWKVKVKSLSRIWLLATPWAAAHQAPPSIWVQLCSSLSILWHCLFWGLEWKLKWKLFQSCGHCWVFQICWHMECSTFTASSFRI